MDDRPGERSDQGSEATRCGRSHPTRRVPVLACHNLYQVKIL